MPSEFAETRDLCVESAMLRNKLPMNNLTRMELDHRAREARLRLERVERLLVPPPGVRVPWLKWLVCRLNRRVLYSGGSPQQGRTGKSLSDQRPSIPGPAIYGPAIYGPVCACN